jgi:hypothetical protein
MEKCCVFCELKKIIRTSSGFKGLSVAEKRDLCTFREQYPSANWYSLCVGDILSVRKKWKNELHESLKWLRVQNLKTSRMH